MNLNLNLKLLRPAFERAKEGDEFELNKFERSTPDRILAFLDMTHVKLFDVAYNDLNVKLVDLPFDVYFTTRLEVMDDLRRATDNEFG